ncbi:MAG: hypothetical protein ONB25_14295 [candidate division KSB1 bacterium]|nr:hypothetical protein [candidate division KSB1 bacterium]
MHTRNGTGWVTFSMDGTSAYFWEGTRTGQPTRLTSDSRWTDPEDIRMPGSYQKDDHGWDTDNYPGRDHVVGRGLYVITATEEEEKGRDAGRAQATLTVECYGIDCKGDVVVEYDCAENKFYVGGRETTWLDTTIIRPVFNPLRRETSRAPMPSRPELTLTSHGLRRRHPRVSISGTRFGADAGQRRGRRWLLASP